MEDDLQRFKLILLGNIDVGKTSLILRFIDNEFTDSFSGEIDQKNKICSAGGRKCEIIVNDTAGQERFRALTSSYYRSAHAIIVAYDITNRESFDDVEGFVKEGERYSELSLKFLIGNKYDLDDKRVVSTEEAQALADKLKMPFLEVSAKTAHNTEQAFQKLVDMLFSEFPAIDTDQGDSKKSKKNKNCVIS